jgi:hypothetical protein
MTPLKTQIVILSDAYGRAVKLGRKRISTIVFNRGSKIDQIDQGGDLNTASYERALQWFSAHWPEGAEWPADVPRPVLPPMPEAAE